MAGLVSKKKLFCIGTDRPFLIVSRMEESLTESAKFGFIKVYETSPFLNGIQHTHFEIQKIST